MKEKWRKMPEYPRIESTRAGKIKRDGRLTKAKQILYQSRRKIIRVTWRLPWDRSLLARKSANPRRGQRHGNHKLTNAAVRHIRESAESISALANRYKVWPQTIHQVRTHRAWRHLPN